jgi:hypothetical protein
MARKKITKSDALYLEWKKSRNKGQDNGTEGQPVPTPVLSKEAEENRRRDPEIAAWVDKIREYFPGAKVTSIRPTQATHEQE